MYAGDVARAIVRLFEGEPPRERVYNLSPPASLSLRQLVECLAAAAGVTARLVDAPWSEIHAAGLERSFSPYASPWSSVLDPTRAAGEWGLLGTPMEEYLPRVVRWHMEHRPARSHRGYASRALEIELASRARALG